MGGPLAIRAFGSSEMPLHGSCALIQGHILWAVARFRIAYKPHHDLWSPLCPSLRASSKNTHRLNRLLTSHRYTCTQRPPRLWSYPPPTPPHPISHPPPLSSLPTDSSLSRDYHTTRKPPSQIPSSKRKGYTNRRTCVPHLSPWRPPDQTPWSATRPPLVLPMVRVRTVRETWEPPVPVHRTLVPLLDPPCSGLVK